MPPLERASKWPFIGIGTIVCMAFVDGASAKSLHWWEIVVLYLAWLPMVVSAIRHWTSTRTVLWLAAASIGTWIAALLIAAA